jgi:hypothetical protein
MFIDQRIRIGVVIDVIEKILSLIPREMTGKDARISALWRILGFGVR